MPQTYRKNKNSNDSTTPVLTTPDGTEIQITQGRKLQQIRSYARDPEITDAQFRALFCIIDRLNEGKEGTDESRWGTAYPNFETLAKDIAKDERAAKRIVKELESGQRQARSGGKTEFVPCKSVLSVQRSKDEVERDSVNLYRLREWGAFAIDASAGEGEVTCEEGCGHLQGRVLSPANKGAVTAPDSSHLLPSKTHLTNPPQLAPACGERGPADGLDDGQVEAINELRMPDHDMSDLDAFEFLRAAYGNSRPEDAEEEWRLFQGTMKSGHMTVESLVEAINLDRGVYDSATDLTKHPYRTFRWLLKSSLDYYEEIHPIAIGGYHTEPCDQDAPF